MAVIGIDLGGTKLAAALFSTDGGVQARLEWPIEGRGGDAVASLVTDGLAELVSHDSEGVTGVGMCVPGIYNRQTGRVWAPNISGWDDFPLRDVLHATVDETTAVEIASDRACYILGEIWRGAARDCTDAIILAVGTGIGAGIVAHGRILDGRHGIAGAIGWMALDRPFRPEYGRWGGFEYAASGDGLVRQVRDLIDRDAVPGYRGPLRADALTGRDVFAAYDDGDVVARMVIDNAVELWGMAVANLVSVFNPEKILFGGGVFGPAVALLDRIRSEAARWAQPVAMRHVVLEPARLGGDAGLYGAARLVLDAAVLGSSSRSDSSPEVRT